MFEVGQAAVDGLGVVVWPSLLLGSLLQPLLQAVVGAGQEHHQVRSADLQRERGRFKQWRLSLIICGGLSLNWRKVRAAYSSQPAAWVNLILKSRKLRSKCQNRAKGSV